MHSFYTSLTYDQLTPGGHVSLGPVGPRPRQSLSEKHPKRGRSDGTHSSLNTTPRVRTGVSLPDFLPFPRIVRGPVRGICEFVTLFSSPYFPVFDTLNAIRALRGEKDTLFTRFYWHGWCTGPNETCPLPPPPPGTYPSSYDQPIPLLG